MSKKTKVFVIVTFLISIIISLLMYFLSGFKIGKKEIIWPVINTENLDKTINGYRGEFNSEKFMLSFENDIENSLKKQGIEKDDITYSSRNSHNNIDILVKANNQRKNYSFQLIDNFIGIM